MTEMIRDNYVVETQPTRWGWAWAISLPQSVVWAGRPGPHPTGLNPSIAHEMRGPFTGKGVYLFGVPHERQAFGWRRTKRGANNAATRAIRRHRRSESQLAAAQAGYTVETP